MFRIFRIWNEYEIVLPKYTRPILIKQVNIVNILRQTTYGHTLCAKTNTKNDHKWPVNRYDFAQYLIAHCSSINSRVRTANCKQARAAAKNVVVLENNVYNYYCYWCSVRWCAWFLASDEEKMNKYCLQYMGWALSTIVTPGRCNRLKQVIFILLFHYAKIQYFMFAFRSFIRIVIWYERAIAMGTHNQC